MLTLPACLQGLPSLSLLAAWDQNLELLEDKRNIEAEEEGRQFWRFSNSNKSWKGSDLSREPGWNVSSFKFKPFPLTMTAEAGEKIEKR